MPLLATIAYNSGSNSYMVALGRFFFGSIMLFVVNLIKKQLKIGKEALLTILKLSIAYTLTPLFLYSSYSYIDSGLATTLHFTYPLSVLLISALIFKEKINKKQLFFILLCFLGIILCYSPKANASIFGMLIALLSGLSFATYTALLGRSKLKEIPILTMTFYLALFATIEIFIVTLLLNKFSFQVGSQAYISNLILAFVSTFIGLTLFQKGVFLCGSVKASLFSTFEPITGIVIGVIFLNESIGIKTIIGIILILTSTILIAKD